MPDAGPFRVIPDPEKRNWFAVRMGNNKGVTFRSWSCREHAQHFADRLNHKWVKTPAGNIVIHHHLEGPPRGQQPGAAAAGAAMIRERRMEA